MAPLYKRYIPPKPSTTVAPVLPAVKPEDVSIPASDEAPKKRKRERTEEEIAERKAKKLRKKGIDPATVLNQAPKQNEKATTAGAKDVEPAQDFLLESTSRPEGEFAHIKNAKKRHKLEKEARKARKATVNSSDHSEAKKDEVVSKNKENVPTRFDPIGPDQWSKGPRKATTRLKTYEEQPEARESAISRNIVESSLKKAGENARDLRLETEQPNEHNEENYQAGTSESHAAAHAQEKVEDNLSRPKKRRHKLESILKQSESQPQGESIHDDDHLRKHEGVMNKFQKSKQLSQMAPKPTVNPEPEASTEPMMLDLGPLPQPEKAPTPEFVPDPSALPEWLAKPTLVSNNSKVSFVNLKLESKVVQHLSKLGLENAMPVQQALIPLLLPPGTQGAKFLPGTETVLPDVAVGAPTGSGKTIAYLLPIIESLKKTAGIGRLRTLVIVPTRELVMQVAAVADSLSRGSNVKIGMATGSGNFGDEQTKLVKIGRQYDPEAYQNLMAKAHRRNYPPEQDSEDFEEYLAGLENEDVKEDRRVRDVVSCLVDHVPTYESSVDILVATPGRLLEHVGSSLGFSLAYLEWLVLDEADKLIDQQYQGFLETVNKELERPRRTEEQDPREQYLRSKDCWNEQRERRVRKVVLSATMTRDISKLVELKLKRPRMILVRGQEDGVGSTDTAMMTTIDEDGGVRDLGNGFGLPPTLLEYCVHAGDGSEKPLFLAELLRTRILAPSGSIEADTVKNATLDEISDASESDSESSSYSAAVSQPDSNADTDSDRESNADEAFDAEPGKEIRSPENSVELETAMHPDRAAMLESFSLRQKQPSTTPTVLIFTSSTEAANRLSHLLKKLHPDLAPSVYTMTRAEPKKNPFSKSKPTDPIITISTDRAARGLDAIANRPITHVLQYDVPRSATGYVHRVGRTARAGRQGAAWTLYTHSEARWFFNEVSKVETIKRAEPIEKVKLTVGDDEMRVKLAGAVAEMRDEVHGQRRRTR